VGAGAPAAGRPQPAPCRSGGIDTYSWPLSGGTPAPGAGRPGRG